MKRTSAQSNPPARDVYYSIGIDKEANLKEKIAELHGADSEPMLAAFELDRYIGDPQTRTSPWYWSFCKKVRSAMWGLYPHADDRIRTTMARHFIGDLFNGGYLRAMQSLAVPSGLSHVAFARDYASQHGVSIGAVLLFGPRGGAIMELLHFLAAEQTHGMHRPGTSPDYRWSKQAGSMWLAAQKTRNWPTTDNEGIQIAVDLPEENGRLPEGETQMIRDMWRRNPALRDYTGTNRLSGDIAYQIIEDVLHVLIQRRFSPLDDVQKARYNQIVEQANSQGIDPFYAAYHQIFANTDRWRPLWNKARRLLHDYSLLLWEKQNELWLSDGRRIAASGVVHKAKKTTPRRTRKKRAVPGTIYLNNGRYYWTVAGKMKPRPLIDPNSKPKVPGTIFSDGGRYYWIIPRWLKRQRLVADGERFSTRDRNVAEAIACRKWRLLQKEKPRLARRILDHTRSQGLATKDRDLAERIVRRLWRQIQRENPKLAARILQDNRPKAKDHWRAQIKAGGRLRYIGSFQTRAAAEAAYAREFEKVHGYPPGYNVQCKPKMDKVWPTWQEEKARLSHMSEQPRIPVIGQYSETAAMVPMIERMQKIDWLRRHTVVVFDDYSPAASAEVAVQSRGRRWYEKVENDHRRAVIRGSASMDKDTDRVRITIYRPGFEDTEVLGEEVYHIGLKVIRYERPQTFGTLCRWHDRQVGNGGDPTFSMPDMFAHSMALEESGIRTSLPRSVVKSVQRLLSPSNRISPSVMKQVKATWSLPQ